MDSATSTSETSGNVVFIAIISSLVCFGIYICVKHFLNVAEKLWFPWMQWDIKLQTESIY